MSAANFGRSKVWGHLQVSPLSFRIEMNPGAGWTARILEEISSRASVIQLEAIGPLTDELISLLQHLDNRQESFSLRLVVGAEDEKLPEFFGPLSRLKKLSALLVKVSAPGDSSTESGLIELLAAPASAGLKPGLLIELHPEAACSELDNFIRQARHSGALEIGLRPSLPAADYAGPGKALLDCLANLKNSGFPVVLEECLATDNLNLRNFELNCRRGFGSCHIDRQGLVRACRQSDKILGDLSWQNPGDVWQKFLFAQNLCPLSEISGGQKEKNEEKEENEHAEMSSLSPINLDSSLRPVPLFVLRKKEWGASLIKGLDGLLLTPRGTKIAALIDGQNTLGLIRKKYGLKAVQLVLALFLKGFVRLEK